jgi:hypothetical protein
VADLGAIGRSYSSQTAAFIVQQGSYNVVGGVATGGGPGAIAYRLNTDGNPAAPSQYQRRGILKGILWPFVAGTRTLTIRVRHSGHAPYPRLIVKANPEAGVPDDLVVTASSSTAWQELSVQITSAQGGAVHVWREVRAIEQGAYAIWDHLVPP